jgi:acyl-CoA thioester hydrolase
MSDVATTRSAAAAARALTLDDFPVHRPVTTRWSDNDMSGHLNNAVYYELFDSAINGWQAEHVTTDPLSDPTQGVVAESGCSFFAEVGFPSSLVVGLRVTRIGRTSITYELGLFIDPSDPSQTPDDSGIKALGHWVHVEIDAVTRRPTPIPDHLRTLLESAVQPPPASPLPPLTPLTPLTPEADAS